MNYKNGHNTQNGLRNSDLLIEVSFNYESRLSILMAYRSQLPDVLFSYCSRNSTLKFMVVYESQLSNKSQPQLRKLTSHINDLRE